MRTISRNFIIFIFFLTACFLSNCRGSSSQVKADEGISKALLSGELIEMEEELLDTELNGKESQSGSTFLHVAARTGKLDIVQDIIKTVININSVDSYGNTPLHYAVINGWLNITEFLINKGADVNIRNNFGQTPLHFAAQSIAGVDKYIPSIPPLDGSITSEYSIRRNPFSGKYQFHRGVDLGAPVGTPIKATAEGTVIKHGWYGVFGNVIIIKHENGLVTVYGHCKEIKVRKGSKVRQGQVIALVGQTGSATGYHCHYEVRNNGMAVNPIPYTHLNKDAGDKNSVEIIKLLLDKSSQFNSKDMYGKTALHYAAMKSPEAVQQFVLKGSALNIQDNYGMTPLHYAVMNDAAVTQKLLKSGARVNIRSTKTFTTTEGMYFTSGSTPLTIAMKKESLDMAKLLLKWGGVE
jgi:ankyrin repeat protein